MERFVFSPYAPIEITAIGAYDPEDGTFTIERFEIPERLRGHGHGTKIYRAFEAAIVDRFNPVVLYLFAADIGGGESDGFWQRMGYRQRTPLAEAYEETKAYEKWLTAGAHRRVDRSAIDPLDIEEAIAAYDEERHEQNQESITDERTDFRLS